MEKEKDSVSSVSNDSDKKKKGILIFAVLIGIIVLGGGAFAIRHFLTRTRYITTGNARVTTDLISLHSSSPGLLEHFAIYEGMEVREGEILGWIQNGEAFRSPVNGIVVDTSVITGQFLLPMDTLATIAAISDIRIQANIDETDILDIQLGQAATATIDGFGNRRFNGYISNIGRITQAELAGMPISLNTGNFRRITHTIPVEITITDDVDLSHFLGASANVSLPVLNETVPFTENNSARNSIITTGTVESTLSRNIYAPHTLRIEDIHVAEGDYVTEGQVLATLDAADLETEVARLRASLEQERMSRQITAEDLRRMLAEAESSINNNTNMHILSAESAHAANQIQLENAIRSYNEALADYENGTNPQVAATESILRQAAIDLERLESDYTNFNALHAAGAISQREVVQARDALESAINHHNSARINHESALESERRQLEQLLAAVEAAQTAYNSSRELAQAANAAARQEINRLQASLQAAEIDSIVHLEYALAQMERHLAEGVITSPINGTVTNVTAGVGEFALGRLFTIEDTDGLRIITRIREYALNGIYEGMEVRITSYATGNEQHRGVITRISPRAVSTYPIVEFEAEISIMPNTSLRIGSTARIEIDFE